MGYVNKTYLSTQFKNFADKIAKVFSKIGHTHLKSDITDFPTSMPANGGNAATVGGHTVGVNVPSNAKFTDTTYSKLSEFTDDVGYVKDTDSRLSDARPANGGTADKVSHALTISYEKDGAVSYQSFDGSADTELNISVITDIAGPSKKGLMSAEDKFKLDGIQAGATKSNKPLTINLRQKESTLSMEYTGEFEKSITIHDWETGTTAGTVCAGNDARLSDARPANGGTADKVNNILAILGTNGTQDVAVQYDGSEKTSVNLMFETGNSKNNITTFTSNDSTTGDSTAPALLTSGETHASILNKVSTIFKNVRWLLSKMGTTDISALGNGTVTGALSTLNSNISGKQNALDSPLFYLGTIKNDMNLYNTRLYNGYYYIANTPANAPTSINVSYAIVLVLFAYNDFGVQIIIKPSNNTFLLRERSGATPKWSTWKKITMVNI